MVDSTHPAYREFYGACLDCLMTDDPLVKADKVALLHTEFEQYTRSADAPQAVRIETPGIPGRPHLVEPQQVTRRGFGSVAGRVALLHALAHIEFNAINLALDAAYRFRDLPEQVAGDFARDWVRVAADEARHYKMVAQRLQTLDSFYGAHDAHAGLWNMALKTDHDVMVRMALVPRVLEARGLDVAPPMIEKFRKHNDIESAEILQVIFTDEIEHVRIGNHWFRYTCEQRGLAPSEVFADLLRQHSKGFLRGPYNEVARVQAGFSMDELDALKEIEAEWSD